ncbi:DUF551 domain-containing protein [Teichococcus aestuarii]|uniref:DUF551 domain-containing protein n=1 Tax=Teichococcus aestuarii TaxID=568898 RepID=UPI0011B2551B|nr:DUF551 domain-containing protein [Pseudoroseomonas aestuarii]
MRDWQDISTAPQDRTPVLVSLPSEGNALFAVALFTDGRWLGCVDGILAFDPANPSALLELHPTHWMALPAPPG